jgi:hypothetical protein
MPKAKESTPRNTTAKTSSSTKGMGTVGKVMHEYKLGTLKCGTGPVQREMERGALSASKYSAPSGRGFSRHKGLPIRCVFGKSAKGEPPRPTSSR